MQKMFSQWGVACPPGSLRPVWNALMDRLRNGDTDYDPEDDLSPWDILMHDSELRKQFNAERLAYGNRVLAETDRLLAAQRAVFPGYLGRQRITAETKRAEREQERERGHFLRPGNPNAVPEPAAPRPSAAARLTDEEIATAAVLIASLGME
jgi:hypothetical protein